MIDNMNKNFVDFWFSGSLQDCGEINNICIVNLNEIEICDDYIIKKLNNNYSESNTNNSNESYAISSDSNINESNNKPYSCDNTKSRNSQTNRRKNTNDRNETIKKNHVSKTRINNISNNNNPKKYINIQSNANPTITDSKRELFSVQSKSRIHERGFREEEILLDSFTKPDLAFS
jgi:hypothetical protein